MPFYAGLLKEPRAVQRRAAKRLVELRHALDAAGVPARTIEDTLLLATWNIREFDSPKYGERSAESFYYIAEIVSHFDLVAVQEVREDVRALDRLQSILGGWWKYIVTDVTEGTGGNGERLAYLYDSRKVAFAGLAGELVLPEPKSAEVLQFARTPFICGFKAGWSKFNLCTVHIYYGTAKANDPRRVREIQDLAKVLAKRARAESTQPARPDGKTTIVRNTGAENLILLGDFNIFSRDDETMKALSKAGFIVPDALRAENLGSNVKRTHFYDQIAVYPHGNHFETTKRGGVFDYFGVVFKPEEEKAYGSLMGEGYAKKKTDKERSRYYGDWRTFQMSDHLLMWAEIKIGWAEEYLQDLLAAEQADE